MLALLALIPPHSIKTHMYRTLSSTVSKSLPNLTKRTFTSTAIKMGVEVRKFVFALSGESAICAGPRRTERDVDDGKEVIAGEAVHWDDS
jgi:hypothetical protein